MAILGPHGFLNSTATASGGGAGLTFIENNDSGVFSTVTYSFGARTLHATNPVFIALGWRGAAGSVSLVSFTMNGVAGTTDIASNMGRAGSALGHAVPGAASGTIECIFSGACVGLAYSTWHAAPVSTTPVDAVSATGSSTATITLSALAVESGGFVLYAQCTYNGPTSLTQTWSGVDTLTERRDGVGATTGTIFNTGEISTTSETVTTRNLLVYTDGTAAVNRTYVAASYK